ncbi:lmo0937 family membrane protein [Chitinophaga caeni]|uniref:lmo0937 family membrane protein n=1 Tax=Chitinophaga caeni TaxID=2029983 RepID=UPI0012FDE3B6|nr:lmo0937 family membrane protein [Chitinophaga caeni]
MNHLFYALAVLLFLAWLLGVFIFAMGGVFHLLIVLAIISFLFQLAKTTSNHP